MVEIRPQHISAIDGEPDLRKDQTSLDLGDLKSVKAADKAKKTDADIARETLRTMMLEERNRKWFYNFIALCHILRNPFSSDGMRMSFECGEMNIGQQLFLMLQDACPDLYLQMTEENHG